MNSRRLLLEGSKSLAQSSGGSPPNVLNNCRGMGDFPHRHLVNPCKSTRSEKATCENVSMKIISDDQLSPEQRKWFDDQMREQIAYVRKRAGWQKSPAERDRLLAQAD